MEDQRPTSNLTDTNTIILEQHLEQRPTNEQLIQHLNVALDHIQLVRKKLELRCQHKLIGLNEAEMMLRNCKARIDEGQYEINTSTGVSQGA